MGVAQIVDVRGARDIRITVDNPANGNRFTVAMLEAFARSISSAHDGGCDVLVVCANGPDFSLGRDAGEQVSGTDARAHVWQLIAAINRDLSTFPGVSVAVGRGRAVGFGAGILAQCDISVASETTTLQFDEVRRGFAPAFVNGYLSEIVGWKWSRDLLFTGRQIDANEGRQAGMLTRVVPDADLERAADDLIAELLGHNPEAIRGTKWQLRALRGMDLTTRLEYAQRAL